MSDDFSIALHLLARAAARRNPILVQQTPSGGYDVTLRLDGTYTDADQAQRVADLLTEALAANTTPPRLVPFDELRDTAPGDGLDELLAAVGDPFGEPIDVAELLKKGRRR